MAILRKQSLYSKNLVDIDTVNNTIEQKLNNFLAQKGYVKPVQ